MKNAGHEEQEEGMLRNDARLAVISKNFSSLRRLGGNFPFGRIQLHSSTEISLSIYKHGDGYFLSWPSD
jgi:hypothetical protein